MTDKQPIRNWSFFQGFVDDLNIPDEWVDVSYHNDTCPSWTFNGYQIFIDSLDKEMSEHPNDPRFRIIYSALYGEHNNLVKSAEKFRDVLQFLKENNANDLNQLTNELNEWLSKEGLPEKSCALELQMFGDISQEQRLWLESFSLRWEEAERLSQPPSKMRRVFYDTLKDYDDNPAKGFVYLQEGDQVVSEFMEDHFHILIIDDKYHLTIERSEYERELTPEGLKELESYLFDWICGELNLSKIEIENNARNDEISDGEIPSL